MPRNHLDIAEAIAAKFPDLLKGNPELDPAVLNLRREYTRRVAQTCLALYPDEAWTHKSRGPGAEASKDVIQSKGMLVELLIGAGTATPEVEWVEIGPLGDQYALPVPAQNWLAVTTPPSDPPPVVIPPPVITPPPTLDLSGVVSALLALGTLVSEQSQKIAALTAKVQALETQAQALASKPFPTYTGTLFGFTFTLSPK